jgi:nucleoside-diphosphate-sugar epimerase
MTTSISSLPPLITFPDKSPIPTPHGPYEHGQFEAYSASKALALRATYDFIATQKPTFDIINTLPAFFIGKNELITSLDKVATGTNGMVLGPILGNKASDPLAGTTVFVNDVAKVQVLALNPKIEGNQNFMLSSEGVNGVKWDDAIEIVRRNFPEEVKKGVFKLDGTQPTTELKIDSARTEEVFGFKLASFEEQVKSIVGHYLELI